MQCMHIYTIRYRRNIKIHEREFKFFRLLKIIYWSPKFQRSTTLLIALSHILR